MVVVVEEAHLGTVHGIGPPPDPLDLLWWWWGRGLPWNSPCYRTTTWSAGPAVVVVEEGLTLEQSMAKNHHLSSWLSCCCGGGGGGGVEDAYLGTVHGIEPPPDPLVLLWWWCWGCLPWNSPWYRTTTWSAGPDVVVVVEEAHLGTVHGKEPPPDPLVLLWWWWRSELTLEQSMV